MHIFGKEIAIYDPVRICNATEALYKTRKREASCNYGLHHKPNKYVNNTNRKYLGETLVFVVLYAVSGYKPPVNITYVRNISEGMLR